MEYYNESNKKSLRIVQVAPNYKTIPPSGYGAIERIIYDLTEELVKQGHEVFLFAKVGSKTSAHLIEYPFEHPYVTKFVVENMIPDVDIIHDHTPESLIGMLNLNIPTISSVHDCFRYNKTKYSTFVSAKSRDVLGDGHGYYVHNGVNVENYQYNEAKQDYLLFIGAWMPHKGIELALEVAERTNQRLKVAGPIFDNEYFHNKLKWRIDSNPNIQPMGVVDGQVRQDLFKNAKCVLVPSVCEEAFGLVLIEAMACGTPVLGLNNGAIPEVLSGLPQLICNSVDEMVEKSLKSDFPHPRDLRKYVEERFSITSMTKSYVDLYNTAIQNKK